MVEFVDCEARMGSLLVAEPADESISPHTNIVVDLVRQGWFPISLPMCTGGTYKSMSIRSSNEQPRILFHHAVDLCQAFRGLVYVFDNVMVKYGIKRSVLKGHVANARFLERDFRRQARFDLHLNINSVNLSVEMSADSLSFMAAAAAGDQ